MNHKFQFSNSGAAELSPNELIAAAKEITASDGERIRWIELGRGRPLVVSPALGTPFVSWLPALLVLSADFRIFFALTRGGCEGAVPKGLANLTVQRRGEDLAELIDWLDFKEYCLVAHSSGVSPAIVCLKKLNTLPSHVCFISARYGEGAPIRAEELLQRAKRDPGFMNVLQSIAVSYSPITAADVMRGLLRDFSRLEALLRAFDLSRAFRYSEPLCVDVEMTFVIAEHDPEDVRETTRRIVEAQCGEPWTLVDLPSVGHFFVQDDGDAAATLIATCLSSRKYVSRIPVDLSVSKSEGCCRDK